MGEYGLMPNADIYVDGLLFAVGFVVTNISTTKIP